MLSYAVLDLETETHTLAKRKASPYHPQNYIVQAGWKHGGQERASTKRWANRATQVNDVSWFTELLQNTRLLVGQNIKFDLLYLLYNSPEALAAWKGWVANGGMLWDCQIAQYLLDGMLPASQMLSMDEMAPMYGGTVKVDEVKMQWEAGVPTSQIDPVLLTRYLIGEDGKGGDIGNTEVIFLGQYEAARKTGQVKSILLNTGSLIASTEMERNGMRVDEARGLELAQQMAQELAELRAKMQDSLPKDLPFEFNWGSAQQKSALLFGGQVKYAARTEVRDEAGNLVYYQREEVQPVLDESGQPVRYASGKNAGEVKTRKVKVPDIERGPKTRMEDFFYTFPGMAKPLPEWRTDTPGQYKTGADVLIALGEMEDIPFLQLLSKLTALAKDLGTYYITTDEKGVSKGMLTLIGPDGQVHGSINHTSTVTGRFSISDPNLQNIPKEGKSVVKTLFVSRFAGGKIVQSDFTSLEVYVQAVLTGDLQLINDLLSGIDMHCMRAATAASKPYEEVLEAAKNEEHPQHKVWKKKRGNAKVFSFQLAYGAGVKKIARSLKLPEEEVQAMMDAENARYPGVAKFYEKVTATIEANRRPTNIFVRHPDFPAVACQLGRSYYRTPDNKLYAYTEEPSPEFLAKKGIYQSFSPTQIKNYIVQGGGAEWAKAAMWLAVRVFYANNNWGDRALLINQVHDAIYLDTAPEVEVEAAAALHACMLEASTFIEWYFGWDVPCPVPSETVSGDNMMEEHKLKGEAFERSVEQYRRFIRKTYMANYQPKVH